MIESATLRWLVAMALRSPVAWLLGAGMGAVWPLFAVFLALGVTTSTTPPTETLFEIGFIAGQLGSILAITTLSQGSWWLSRTTPLRRFRAEFVGVATGSFVLIAAAWMIPILLSFSGESLPLGRMFFAAAIGSLHHAAIGVCILALPVQPLTKAALVPLCVWLIPTQMTGEYWGVRIIHQCLDLAGDFMFPWTEESPASVWQLPILPILGLCLLRMAEATRRASHPCATPS